MMTTKMIATGRMTFVGARTSPLPTDPRSDGTYRLDGFGAPHEGAAHFLPKRDSPSTTGGLLTTSR